MVMEKAPSSPSVCTGDVSSQLNNDSRSEPFDLSERGQSSNTSKEDVEAIDLLDKNDEVEERDPDDSPKAEFYIGDERIPSPTSDEEKDTLTDMKQFLYKPSQDLNISFEEQNNSFEKNSPPEFIPPDGGPQLKIIGNVA
ncbi:hypothetical protein Anas_00844 [Armadillidium nasatum]|uniref:Uncharacterized protein n=1 Tax=Armadillidium nasatum TaxID=96803 RepID=A0A5N5T3X0_9CRUS|nr:hypothetical protein Anas_00844 [Armadillidium nasatum]